MRPPLIYEYGKKIYIQNYIARKDEIDAFCCKYVCGYEIHHDGSAVIICD